MVPGQIGLVQATEMIKLILKIGEPLIGKFLIYRALDMVFHLMTVEKNPDCPLCGENPTIKSIKGDDDGDFCHI